jgi:F-type H+-transporting ATPase subunit b
MLKIPPDTNILVPIVILFVVLWVLMRRWWIEPALQLLKERSARSEGAMREAQAVQAEAERLRQQHAAALGETRAEAQREVQDILRAAEAEHKRLVTEAAEDAQRVLSEVRGRISEEIAAARRALQGDVNLIARDVAAKVLGRAV